MYGGQTASNSNVVSSSHVPPRPEGNNAAPSPEEYYKQGAYEAVRAYIKSNGTATQFGYTIHSNISTEDPFGMTITVKHIDTKYVYIFNKEEF